MQIEVPTHGPDERDERLRMIDDSAEAALRGDRARARVLRYSSPGFERDRWVEFANLGWLALRVPEDAGGLGLGIGELCAIARHMGRQLTPEPVLAAAVVAPLLPVGVREQVISGERIVLPAFAAFVPSHRHDVIGATHEPVAFGGGADAYLVAQDDVAFLIERDELGLLSLHATHDGGHVLDVVSPGEKGQRLAVDLRGAREEATLALSAYLLGVSEAAFELTLQYLKDRKQFDKPIGAFQALQHLMVDLYLELSLLNAAVDAAAAVLDQGEGVIACAKMVSLAKARANKASSLITRSAIQLHGGIGYTDEADIGLYLRKVMILSGLLGTERFHRDRAFKLAGAVA